MYSRYVDFFCAFSKVNICRLHIYKGCEKSTLSCMHGPCSLWSARVECSHRSTYFQMLGASSSEDDDDDYVNEEPDVGNLVGFSSVIMFFFCQAFPFVHFIHLLVSFLWFCTYVHSLHFLLSCCYSKKKLCIFIFESKAFSSFSIHIEKQWRWHALLTISIFCGVWSVIAGKGCAAKLWDWRIR